jgi:hypothetical protein
MALTDWVINKSSPLEVTVGVDPITFLVGTGSLHLIDLDNSTMNMYNSTYSRGLTRGRMRMLIRLEDAAFGDDSYAIGMYIMADGDNITIGDSFGRKFYSWALTYDVNTTSHRVELQYHDDGIEDSPLTILQTGQFTLTRGQDVVPLELEWKLEDEFGPGIRFTPRTSTTPSILTDFSNLTDIDDFIYNDPTTTLLAASSEGLYFEGLGGSFPSGLDAIIDQVSIFSLTPA